MVSGLLPEPLQKQPGAVPVLNVGGTDDHIEHVSDCIDDHVAFASPDVFSSVVASLPVRFGCLDALAVDDCICWFGISVPIGALLLAQSSVGPASRAVKTPFSVVIVNAVGIGKIVWEIVPLAASTENVKSH